MILSMDGIGSVFAAMPSLDARKFERERTLSDAIKCCLDFSIYMDDDDIHGISNVVDKQNQILLDGMQYNKIDWILYFEDDLEINCEMFRLATKALAALAADENIRVFSLYLAGKRFYPASVKRNLGYPSLFKTVSQNNFFGSQALFLHRDVVDTLLPLDGPLDTALQTCGFDIYSFVPNPVQHRAPPSLWSVYGKSHTSISYVEP